MTLQQLKNKVDAAIEYAKDCGRDPKQTPVSLQIDGDGNNSVWSSKEVELHYDNDITASGCVLTAYSEKVKNDASAFAS